MARAKTKAKAKATKIKPEAKVNSQMVAEPEHSDYGPSRGIQFTNCAGSREAQEGIPDKPNIYAAEGDAAHGSANLCLRDGSNMPMLIGENVAGGIVDDDMVEYVQEYLDYVRSFETEHTQLFSEQYIEYRDKIPKGYGRLDASIINWQTGECHIFEFKYGVGNTIKAKHNIQLQLQAMGMLNAHEYMGVIKSFALHVVQPRLKNFSRWDISLHALGDFSNWVVKKAIASSKSGAVRTPGIDQCQHCRAKGNCSALADMIEQTLGLSLEDFAEFDTGNLTDYRKRLILENSELIKKVLSTVADDAHNAALNGYMLPGFKFVFKKGRRMFDAAGEIELVKLLGDGAHIITKKLIGIGIAVKQLGDKKVNEIAILPTPKQVLVTLDDPREAVEIKPVDDYFENLDQAKQGEL